MKNKQSDDGSESTGALFAARSRKIGTDSLVTLKILVPVWNRRRRVDPATWMARLGDHDSSAAFSSWPGALGLVLL
jgi:hypothetical protein